MNNQTFIYSPSVQDYMLLNGFERLDNNAVEGGMCFVKDNKHAVIFLNGHIDYKTPGEYSGNNKIANIMFGWKSQAKYDGFDGHSKFALMMLLHIMKAIPFNDFVKVSRGNQNMPHLNMERNSQNDISLLIENACQQC